jgi:DNA mismatch repair protein MutL
MSERDARMSFERHATSKLSKTEDLFSIRTFGFRGEALASIAAVAQVELKSRKEENELGTSIKIEGSEIKSQESVSCEKGSSISVKNLFFNVPARRNFLKSNPVELKHIIDEFQRVALAYPHITFTFYNNDLEVFNLPGDKLSKRIVSMFGAGYKEQLISCQEDTNIIKIHGYIGKPEHSKKSRGEQFFFVNNRYIRHNYLHHAVMNAFDELLSDENFPFYVLFIDIDPKHIDINVHPTKTEIKFDDEKTVYAIIRAAVKKSLATHNIIPSIDFDHNINFGGFGNQYANKDFKNQKTEFHSERERSNKENWEDLYKNFETDKTINSEFKQDQNENTSMIIGSAANNMESSFKIDKEQLYTENPSTFQLHNKYIVTQIRSGMMLVDQQAAHERILYEKYLTLLQNKFGASQQFLFPQSIELSHADFALVMEMEEDIRALGFVFTIFGKTTLVVNGIPADVPSGSEKDLFEGLIEQFKKNKMELKIERRENLARAMARKSSLKPGTKLTPLEMNTLIDQLFGCKVPNYAPTGNLTIVILDMEKIAKYFSKA